MQLLLLVSLTILYFSMGPRPAWAMRGGIILGYPHILIHLTP